jgi:hypothetical protein
MTAGTRSRGVDEVKDPALDTGPQDRDIEVDEKPDRKTREPKIRERLRFMDRGRPFDAFQFRQDRDPGVSVSLRSCHGAAL